MVTIRPATSDDAAFIWQVQSTGWQQTYQGILSDEFLAGLQSAMVLAIGAMP